MPSSHPTEPNIDAELILEFCVQADVEVSTRIKYRAHLTEFSRWLSHARTEALVTPGLARANKSAIVRYLAYLRTTDRFAAGPQGGRRGPLSSSSRKNVLGSLGAFYEYIVDVEIARANPVNGVRRPKPKVQPGLHLSASELSRLLEVRGSARDRIQAHLLAYTAARSGELRNLRWHDVNIHARTLTLRSKGRQHRVIDIHPCLMPELRRWRAHLDELAARNPAVLAALSATKGGHVLVTRSGRSLSSGAISKQLKRRAVRADLHPLAPAHGEHRSLVSPHALRRTFATLLLNDGHHLDAIADVLGHESLDTTRNHYAFSSNARRRATIEAFNV